MSSWRIDFGCANLSFQVKKMKENNVKFRFATDNEFLNCWKGQPGLIIGSGESQDYKPKNPDLSKFPGKIIGCNEACTVYDRLDLIIWIDNIVIYASGQQMKAFDCLKMCVNPSDPWDYLGQDIIALTANPPKKFSPSFEHGFYPCDSTGYLAYNVALLMGLNPIWLYGFHGWKHPYFEKNAHFSMGKGWLNNRGKRIYCGEKTSYLCSGNDPVFPYKPIPLESEIFKSLDQGREELYHGVG